MMAIPAPKMAAIIPIAAPNRPTTTPKSAANRANQIGNVRTRSTTTSNVDDPDEERAIIVSFCFLCSKNRSAFYGPLNFVCFRRNSLLSTDSSVANCLILNSWLCKNEQLILYPHHKRNHHQLIVKVLNDGIFRVKLVAILLADFGQFFIGHILSRDQSV
jgi:hypothetical protein